MTRCPELSRLPKIKPGSARSLDIHRVLPGSPHPLLPRLSPRQRENLDVLDSNHPAVSLWRRSSAGHVFPYFPNPLFNLWAFPKALLEKPALPWPDPPFTPPKYVAWEDRSHDSSSQSSSRVVDVTVVPYVSKNVHKSSAVRRRLRSKILTTVSLITVRGANSLWSADANGGSTRLVFNEDSKIAVLPDWVYLFRPTLELYQKPYPDIVAAVRRALEHVLLSGSAMEERWRTAKPNPTLRRNTSRIRRRSTIPPYPISSLTKSRKSPPPPSPSTPNSTKEVSRLSKILQKYIANTDPAPPEDDTLHTALLQDMVKELGLTSINLEQRRAAPERIRNQGSSADSTTDEDGGKKSSSTRVHTALFQQKPFVIPRARRKGGR